MSQPYAQQAPPKERRKLGSSPPPHSKNQDLKENHIFCISDDIKHPM
jgi:hypothetical protein